MESFKAVSIASVSLAELALAVAAAAPSPLRARCGDLVLTLNPAASVCFMVVVEVANCMALVL